MSFRAQSVESVGNCNECCWLDIGEAEFEGKG